MVRWVVCCRQQWRLTADSKWASVKPRDETHKYKNQEIDSDLIEEYPMNNVSNTASKQERLAANSKWACFLRMPAFNLDDIGPLSGLYFARLAKEVYDAPPN